MSWKVKYSDYATQHRTAASYAAGKRALEVACGSGMGLGYMAHQADQVVGGDCSESLLQTAG